VFPTQAQVATPAATPAGASGGILIGNKFAGQTQIYRVDSDGSHAKPLTASDQNEFPAWSPDGSQIAFTTFNLDTFMAQIMIMNADGSNAHALTDPALNPFGASWSPDGKQIAFFALPPKAHVFGGGSLYTINADGTHVTKILDDGTDRLNWLPAWSPDGKRIAFTSNRGDGTAYQIYTLAPDGSDIQPLTDSKTDPGTNSDRVWPVWSPDGKQIAFLAGHVSFQVPEGGTYDVYVMNADGSNVRQLTHVNNVTLGLAWSSDGKQIAYLAGKGQKVQLFEMDADGSNAQAISIRGALLQSVGLSWFVQGSAAK
jgi:TolB protein